MNYSERIEMNKKHNLVRDWLNGLPGTIESEHGPEACWRKAWAACGVENVGIDEFKAILKVYGLGPVEPLGGKHILRLPGKPMVGPNPFDKLNHILR